MPSSGWMCWEYVAVYGCVRALTTAVVAVTVAVGGTSGPPALEAESRIRAADAEGNHHRPLLLLISGAQPGACCLTAEQWQHAAGLLSACGGGTGRVTDCDGDLLSGLRAA